MLTPNKGRIIVELLRTGEKEGEIYLPTRENVKAGENLLIGKVVHPGESELKKGTLVMFQEYSLSGVYKDVKELAEGKVGMTEASKTENQLHVIAELDIMAYEK